MHNEGQKPSEVTPTQPQAETPTNQAPQVSRRGFLAGAVASAAGLFGLNRIFNHADQQAASSSAGQTKVEPTPLPTTTRSPQEQAIFDASNNVNPGPTPTLSTDTLKKSPDFDPNKP